MSEHAASGELAVGRPSSSDSALSKTAMTIVFVSCIFLQRFGYLQDRAAIYVCMPVAILVFGYLLLRKYAEFDVRLLINFVGFCACIALSTAFAFGTFDPDSSVSLTSPMAILVVYGLMLLKPTARFDRSKTLVIFTYFVRICCILGLFQYVVQYVGIYIFSFKLTFPWLNFMLVEDGYNYDPVISYLSAYRRSNGFFLLEPSIFSQTIVIAASIEYFVLKKFRALPLYAAAYAVSYSGTGLLCLAIALPFFGALFYQEARKLLSFALAGILLIGVVSIALPDQFSRISNRSNELTAEKSSGYARYTAQFITLNEIVDRPRALVGWGPGSTERASFVFPGSSSPVLKIMVDYGLLGAIFFFSFFLRASWRRDLSILPVLLLSVYQFGGGNFLFVPFMIQFILLLRWSGPPVVEAAPADEPIAVPIPIRGRAIA